jgi:hypothetical protein
LFGYTGHLGFRGGWSLESYLNFGWIGVVLLAAANGWLLGRLERCFYVGFVRDRRPDYAQVYTFGWLAYLLHTILIASSATYDVYSLLVALAGIWLVENVYSTRRGRSRQESSQRPVHARKAGVGEVTWPLAHRVK